MSHPRAKEAQAEPQGDRPLGTSAGGWKRKLAGLSLVAMIFLLHVALRLDVVHRRPSLAWPSYAHCYSTSLSLLLGHGYYRLPLAPDAASQPIKGFLDQQREHVSAEEIAAYKTSIPRQQSYDVGRYAYVDTARVFDMYLAAAIWKVCGVSWSSLSNAHAVFSALAGLAIFFSARALTGRFALGAFAAFLFAVAPHEQAVRLTRDLNPIWFSAFAFAWLFCLTNRFRNPAVNLASFFGLGLIAMVGYGWRPDNLILVPFMLAAAVLLARAKGDSWKFVTAGTACGLAGSALIWAVVNSAYDLPENALSNRFHVAYFGEETRSNLLGIENSLQIFRDDAKVASDVFVYHDAEPRSGKELVYCGQNYGETCTALYFKTLWHNLFHWTFGIPRVLVQAALGYDTSLLVRWLHFLIFALGLAALAVRNADRLRLSIVGAFFLYYAAIWFGVAPEQRHWGPFLVAICLVGSFAPPVVRSFVSAARSRNWRPWLDSFAWRPPAIVLAGATAVWLLACVVTYFISSGERAEYLAEINKRARHSASAASAITSPASFRVETTDEQQSYHDGYLLTIQTGDAPGEVTCGHLRLTEQQLATMWKWPGSTSKQAVWDDIRNVIWWNAYSETRHRLRANSTERFFVTFCRSQYGGDNRRYTLQVQLHGDAKITDARRLDLKDWKRLQVSTVISGKDPGLISPYVGGATTRTLLQFLPTPEICAIYGIPN